MYVDLGLALLRVVVGGVVMAHGVQKLGYLGGGRPEATVGMMSRINVRPESLWAAIVTGAEIGGGLLTVLGFMGPFGPWLIVADMVVAAVTVHWINGFWNSRGGVEYTLTLGTAALAIALIGNGGWSLDAALRLTVPEWIVEGWIGLVILGVVLALASRWSAQERQGEAA